MIAGSLSHTHTHHVQYQHHASAHVLPQRSAAFRAAAPSSNAPAASKLPAGKPPACSLQRTATPAEQISVGVPKLPSPPKKQRVITPPDRATSAGLFDTIADLEVLCMRICVSAGACLLGTGPCLALLVCSAQQFSMGVPHSCLPRSSRSNTTRQTKPVGESSVHIS